LGEVSLGGELLPLPSGSDVAALLHHAGPSTHTYILPHGSAQVSQTPPLTEKEKDVC
jgi:hypothetical protein